MAQKKKNKRRRRQFQQKVILSVLLVIIIGLIGVLGYQMQKNEKKQTDGNASASSSVSSSSLAGDSSEPISDSSQEEEITPTPEPVQQISSDGLNSQHALLVRESDLAEMMNLGGDERIYPASMTKIMTALLTIENLPDLNETITVPEDIFEELTAQDASVAGFNPYEQPTVRDLLYGVLLPSGADACETLARAVGGSEEGFVAMMNQKAEELGLTNTHFENCTGLHNDNHYSTCRDIAVLMSECLKSDTFREIVTREVYTTEATASHPEGITLYDTMLHRFTSYEMSTTLENGAVIEGGKTGFTDEDAEKIKEALRTLFVNDASAARPDGSMEVCKVYWWRHNCPMGQYSSAKVHRSLKISANTELPKCFEDYSITVEALDGLEPEVIEGV